MKVLHSWFRSLLLSVSPRRDQNSDGDDAILQSGLGLYKWGTGTIWFRNLSAIGSRSPAEVGIDIITQRSVWESDAAFRQTVTYLHELVHYFQDYTTGIGHWDFMLKQEANEALMPTIVSAYVSGDLDFATDGTETLQHILSQSVFNGWPSGNRSHLKTLMTEIASNYGWHPADEIADLFAIDSILETEAVFQTFVTLARTKGSQRAHELMKDNEELVNPLSMQGKYGELCQFLMIQLLHLYGADDLEEIINDLGTEDASIAYAYHFYVYLIDFACAHPPKSFFNTSSLSVDDYNPGVRLMHILHVLAKGDQEDLDAGNQTELEQMLNKVTGLNYLSMDEVYQLWSEELNGLDNEPAALARSFISKERVGNRDAFAKNANGIGAANLPIVYSIEGHEGTYTLSLNEHKWEQDFELMHSRSLWNAIFFECVCACYASREFKCPAAPSCRVHRETCFTGFPLFEGLPEDDACIVRNYFETEAKVGQS